MVILLSYPKEIWSRLNTGLEKDGCAPVHALRERSSPIHAQEREPNQSMVEERKSNQSMAQEGEPDLTKTESRAHSLAMTHGSIHMGRDPRLAMTHEGMHALEVQISDMRIIPTPNCQFQ